jgi:hypothetical protein
MSRSKERDQEIIDTAIEQAFEQAFEVGGDPITGAVVEITSCQNLVVAALDNRRLHKAIGNPLKERCAAIIKRAIQEAHEVSTALEKLGLSALLTK